LLARCHKSQSTPKQFAAQHGVGLSTLSKWLRVERETLPPKAKFQEVRLSRPAPHWPVEIVSPQGWLVRIQNHPDVQMLPLLLQALPC